MDKNFWLDRWQRNQIGFHLQSTHPALDKHWSRVCADSSASVLVPLCGKSLDLRWLAAQGHSVTGVELDRGAVETFFEEAGMTPTIDESGGMPSFSTDRTTLFAGDFFEFEHSPGFDLVYDRAALIALPPEMRPRYLDHLASLMKPGGQGLLITLEYPQESMQGPPFAVMPDELHGHAGFDFKCLERIDVLDSHERFAEKGLPWLREVVYAVKAVG